MRSFDVQLYAGRGRPAVGAVVGVRIEVKIKVADVVADPADHPVVQGAPDVAHQAVQSLVALWGPFKI